ncbi:MAG: ATP-binding protein [Armatimonadetes bacterium]|nr:ATP-binding protein [Armatimonadota bacterium]
MLIEFRVRNYRSFKDEQVLSFVASSGSELEQNTFSAEAVGKKMRVLKSAAVYGPNAAGKSNLIKALRYMKKFVLESAEEGQAGKPTGADPYRLDPQRAREPSRFELTFVSDGGRYQYGFAADSQRVHEEWLTAYPKGQPQMWFERSVDIEGEYNFGPSLKGERAKLTKLTRENCLFLSIGAKFANKQLTEVYSWFRESLQYIDPRTDISGFTAHLIHENKEFADAIHGLLKDADMGIRGVEVNKRAWSEAELPDDMPSELKRKIADELKDQYFYVIRTLHTATEGQKLISFSLDDESDGTQRYFALIGPWLDVLKNGRVLCIDELDTSLHPLLSRTLIALFHHAEINTRGAQLLFTTHDTTLLDNSLFRRDQIWFTEKDEAGASHLYPLLDFRPRKDESLQKGYLAGRYGALPFLGEFRF